MTSPHLDTPAPARDRDGIVRTIDLTKTYEGTDFRAVDALNLSVGVGEIFGLLGPNGAGKTTTAGILTTRVIPTSGQAFIAGIDVVAHPALAKQLVGVVSQTNTLDRQLNVWENLYFHGRLFGIGAAQSRRTSDELLEKFQLAKWAKASVYALSGGMAQRLMVARSIFHKPAVLFMDEPTAGLDPQSRLLLWDILRELNAEGQTIVLTTHYMEEADQLCGRVAIMDHGKILALDTPALLKQGVGADTIVTVKAGGDQQRLAEVLQREVAEISRVRPTEAGIELHVAAATGSCRGSWPQPRAAASRWPTCRWPSRASRPCSSTSPAGSYATDDDDRARFLRALLHRHRTGALRRRGQPHRPASADPPRRGCPVEAQDRVRGPHRGPALPALLRVPLRLPQDRPSRGGKRWRWSAAASSAFATVLIPGVVGISIMFQGVQSVALQMAQEFGYTREIEDRVQAPCPIWLVAGAKVLSGAMQGVISAAIVLPIASLVHAGGIEAHINLHWLFILTLVPISCVAMAALGLVLGTSFEPRNIGLMFGFVVLPITFLGGTYYQWTRLVPVKVGGWHWLQTIVLINPLIYVNEGMRAAFTNDQHMHLYVIYPVLIGFCVLFLRVGLRNFRRRVLA